MVPEIPAKKIIIKKDYLSELKQQRENNPGFASAESLN